MSSIVDSGDSVVLFDWGRGIGAGHRNLCGTILILTTGIEFSTKSSIEGNFMKPEAAVAPERMPEKW
jgi:hypothetical protein